MQLQSLRPDRREMLAFIHHLSSDMSRLTCSQRCRLSISMRATRRSRRSRPVQLRNLPSPLRPGLRRNTSDQDTPRERRRMILRRWRKFGSPSLMATAGQRGGLVNSCAVLRSTSSKITNRDGALSSHHPRCSNSTSVFQSTMSTIPGMVSGIIQPLDPCCHPRFTRVSEIFGGKLKHSDLSHIYRDMDCEHHFIQQSTSKDRPTVPALTPTGFERWMTLLIMSDPNLEYQRFTKAVLNMPISNADDTKERFPKELSRRLFPKHSDTTTRILVDDSIYADGVLTRLRDYARDEAYEDTNHREETMPTPSASTFPLSASKPPCQPHPAASPSVQVQLDRERSFTSSEAITDDTPTSISIERERKPYRAQPGGGKVYENGERLHQRSNTTSGGQRPTFEPVDDYSVSHRYRSGSATAGQPPPPPPPIARQRYRSPSTSQQTNLYSRSDSTVPIGGSYATGGFEDDDGLRRYLSGGEERQLRYRNEDISRDFYGVGPPRTSYEEEQGRRPKATYDYPPPPPPQYR